MVARVTPACIRPFGTFSGSPAYAGLVGDTTPPPHQPRQSHPHGPAEERAKHGAPRVKGDPAPYGRQMISRGRRGIDPRIALRMRHRVGRRPLPPRQVELAPETRPVEEVTR